MRSRVPKMALVAVVLALGACQEPDVGQPCKITWGDPNQPGVPELPTPQNITSDWFESGNTECENLVCIMSPAAEGARYSSTAYCSKPCVSNQDCFESKTGLVCRQMVLDPLFLAQLDQIDPALKQRYLGEVQFSSYCGVPR
jgi:hypothetical protein